jgi:hypothetical protein
MPVDGLRPGRPATQRFAGGQSCRAGYTSRNDARKSRQAARSPPPRGPPSTIGDGPSNGDSGSVARPLRFVEAGSTPSMTDRLALPRDARSVAEWLIDGARDRAYAAGRSGRVVRSADRRRSAAPPGRHLRAHAAPERHGSPLPLAARAGGADKRAAPRDAGEGHLPCQPDRAGVSRSRHDPAATYQSRLPERLSHHRGAPKQGSHRLSDPAAGVLQWRDPCRELDDHRIRRLRGGAHRSARGDRGAFSRGSSTSTPCAAPRPRCSTPMSAATPASGFCTVGSGAATSSGSRRSSC